MTKTGGKPASLVQLGTVACPKLFRSRRQEAAVLRDFCAYVGRDGPRIFVCSFPRRCVAECRVVNEAIVWKQSA